MSMYIHKYIHVVKMYIHLHVHIKMLNDSNPLFLFNIF
jgi:hypothetical protein